MASNSLLYIPALRLKKGELAGLRDLAPDIATHIVPRMIVPPPMERDPSQGDLFTKGSFPDISSTLASHWANKEVLIETTHILDEFGRDQIGLWLPKMFERARDASVQAIPLVSLSDFLNGNVDAYSASANHSSQLKIGIIASSADLADNDSLKRAVDLLQKKNIQPDQSLIIADFHDADFSQVDLVAPIISAVLESLQMLAPWKKIAFQGTNYPEKNPAEPGSYYVVPRNEWLAWQKAVNFDPLTAEHMIFGDYAADCSNLNFGTNKAIAIRHYRYTTGDSWLVQRGLDTGPHKTNMESVCSEILASGLFSGRSFSSADNYIYLTAKGLAGPGNATDWRAINTTHHITRVVNDIGKIKHISFKRKALTPLAEQMILPI
ncbi:hypothetical protein UCD39_11145 [Nitrospirillum sp. BR 11752]|uniref:beta family protein n=1 Tax=Nitrospirillum sp. BR 11752 TaxID=3104293 RepID=UPI002EC7149D|nr:hypothetical protein [Nitrospirillum sp. BR 11752]